MNGHYYYCFLLGAGASADAKLPTSKQLLNKFLLSCSSSTRTHLEKLIANLGGMDNSNAETLAFELLKRNEHRLYAQIRKFTIQLVKSHGNSRYLAQLFSLDYDCMFNFLIGDKPYWKCIRNKYDIPITSTSRFFSLNYDLCMEDATALDQSYLGLFRWNGKSNRYEYDDSVVYDNNKGFFVSPQKPFKEGMLPEFHGNGITKLHGSVNWVWKTNGNDQKLVVEPAFTNQRNIELIFGEPEKLRMTPPYRQVFFAFGKALAGCSAIIVIGYSWSDSHINRLISHELKRGMKLVNVSLYSTDNRHPVDFFPKDAIHVKGKCSSVMRKRTVEYAVGEGSWRKLDNGLAGVLQKVLNKQISKTEKEWKRILEKERR